MRIPFVGLVCLLCAAACAQQGNIALDVVVNDKSGKPVAGLQEKDFQILDDKRPQPILSFQAMSGGSEPVNILIVVDAVNVGFERIGYERDQIRRFLLQNDGKLPRPVSIAVLSDSGLRMGPEGSSDGRALAAYLDGNQTGLRTITRSQGFYGAQERLDLSIAALRQFAAEEADKPGRKLVIWLSPGWPMLSGPSVQLTDKAERSVFEQIVSISTWLRQARIALYGVDPLGTSDAGTYQTYAWQDFLKGVRRPRQVMPGDLALQVISVQTGGRVLNSGNDIAEEIERCVHDADAWYALSFAAIPADSPDEYHQIEVKIVGQLKLKAQTRAGYYAQPVRRMGQ